MVYRDFQDLKLSALGMGAMRLPVVDGDDAKIDKEKTAEMVAYAMEHGINYYDTAWGYHSGNSRGMIFLIWARWKRYLKSSWRNAKWGILIFICSTMSAR